MAHSNDAFRGALSAEALSILTAFLDDPQTAVLADMLAKANADVQVEALAANAALDPDIQVTTLSVTDTKAYTLVDGTRVGQRKDIVCIAVSGSPDGELTPANYADGTTLTFDAVGESATLWWDGTNWRTIAYNGATIA